MQVPRKTSAKQSFSLIAFFTLSSMIQFIFLCLSFSFDDNKTATTTTTTIVVSLPFTYSYSIFFLVFPQLQANTDVRAKNVTLKGIWTHFIRFHPQSRHGKWRCMRLALYGCQTGWLVWKWQKTASLYNPTNDVARYIELCSKHVTVTLSYM